VIAADDGRTLLIDPVANPGFGAKLQDELCLEQIKKEIDEASKNRLPR
jgi:septin family protein